MLPNTSSSYPEQLGEIARELQYEDDDSTQWVWAELKCEDSESVNNVTGDDLGSGLEFGEDYPIGRLDYTSTLMLEIY